MRSGGGIKPTNISWSGLAARSQKAVPRRSPPLCKRRGPMKTTAIYVWVSTDRPAQAQTIQQQVERLQAHLAREGQTLTEDNIFRDDGYSGASLNRPGLDQLRDRVSRACFERVLITSPDRLARRFVHQMLLMEEWERAGCEIQFLDRPMSQDPHEIG